MWEFFKSLSADGKLSFYAVCVSIVVAIISLLGIILTAIANRKSRKSSEKANCINLITSNRVEWINKLREQLATYCSKLYYDPKKNVDDFINEYKNEIVPLATEIKMQLNLKGEPDKELTDVLNKIDISFQGFVLFRDYKLSKAKKEKLTDYLLENFGYLLKLIVIQNEDVLINAYKQFCEESSDHSVEKFKESDYLMKFVDDNINEFSKRALNLIPGRIENGARFVELLGKIYLKAEWDRVRYEAGGGEKSSEKFNEFYAKAKETVKDEYDQLKEKFI